MKNGKEFAKRKNKNLVNEKGYDAKEMYGLTQEEFKEFLDEYLYSYSVYEPARIDADKVLSKLMDDGNELYIITARFNSDRNDKTGKSMRKLVEKWFQENRLVYTEIIYSSDEKLDICLDKKIDIMIEDKPSAIAKISTMIPVICFDAPYNRHVTGKNIHRTTSWSDVYNIIEMYK